MKEITPTELTRMVSEAIYQQIKPGEKIFEATIAVTQEKDKVSVVVVKNGAKDYDLSRDRHIFQNTAKIEKMLFHLTEKVDKLEKELL